ncbi:hypothetical protein ACFVFI_39420, partial [Streptomyces sp. NPDC057705]
HLREDGLVVTGRRGTRPAVTAVVVPAAAGPGSAPAVEQAAVRPASAVPALARTRLTLVTVPPSLAGLLGMAGGDRTLVHHHRERGPAGETLRDAVTYFSPGAVARDPELSGFRDRVSTLRDDELAPLQRWLDRAAAAGRVAETITMT